MLSINLIDSQPRNAVSHFFLDNFKRTTVNIYVVIIFLVTVIDIDRIFNRTDIALKVKCLERIGVFALR